MPTKNKSPKIHSIKWGNILIDGEQEFKDAKLYPGGARAWDWTETGTHHTPGIQPADVQELLDHGAEIVILSRGFNERLKTSNETEQFLSRQDIPYHILQTENAVKKYNELREDHSVGALIHSTC